MRPAPNSGICPPEGRNACEYASLLPYFLKAMMEQRKQGYPQEARRYQSLHQVAVPITFACLDRLLRSEKVFLAKENTGI